MVNQTVAIPSEPAQHRYFKKVIIEFNPNSFDQVQSLYHAISMRDSVRQRNQKEAERLKVKPRELPDEQVEL